MALLALNVSADEPRYFKNIGYLGSGYDLIFGNPHGNQVDPGFKQPILDMSSYTRKRLTPDKRFNLPDNVDARSSLDCSLQSEVKEVSGAKSMYESLSTDVGVEGGGWGFAFSASAAYKSVSASSSAFHKTYVSVKAKCDIYKAFVDSGTASPLKQGFREMVSKLPASADPADRRNPYWNLIRDFGTHYTKSVNMGSKAVLRSEFEQVKWAQMKSSSLNVKVAAKFSFLAFSGGASVQTDSERKQAQQFESHRSDVSENFLGARPSSDGKWETWLKEAGAEPMPFQYKLASVNELLSEAYFPEDKDITSKQWVLYNHLHAYCGVVPDCVPTPTNPSDVGFQQVSNEETQYGEIQCGPGKVAISCGMDMHVKCQSEPFWKVYPSASDTCHCYDYGCDKCYATCVDASAADVTTVSAHGSGHIVASCPSGYKVTGCGINNYKNERYPEVYPSSETQCTCYNYFEADCYATCSKNIGDYRIVNKYDTGHFDIKCPGQTFALGCGLRNKKHGGDYENWLSFHPRDPSDFQTCHCYNYFGTTCYAICGTVVNGSAIIDGIVV